MDITLALQGRICVLVQVIAKGSLSSEASSANVVQISIVFKWCQVCNYMVQAVSRILVSFLQTDEIIYFSEDFCSLFSLCLQSFQIIRQTSNRFQSDLPLKLELSLSM